LLDDEFMMSIATIKQTKQFFLEKIKKITCFSLHDCWEIKWKKLGKQMQPRFLL
jgi:predicted metal-dependent hydrolase